MAISIIVRRLKKSHDYKIDPEKNSFENNWKNNSLDYITILDGDKFVEDFKCQTVSNHPGHKYGDTLIPGRFQVKAFVDPRKFHGEIHGIINTEDFEGHKIDRWSMQIDNGYQTGRWLIHDRYSFKTGKDTNYAWSGGCIILSSADLAEFNKILKSKGVKPGDVIEAYLVEL